MPLFEYKAKDRAGNTVTGSLDAVDERGVAEKIREMGHLPMTISRADTTPPETSNAQSGGVLARYILYPLWTGVNIRMLAVFYRQFATLLGSGMSVAESLRSIASRTRGRLGVIIDEAQRSTSAGGKLSDSFSRHPRVFSRLQLALIRAGESGGMLDSMLDRIAQQLEYEIKIRGMIAKAMVYPIVVLVFAALVNIGVPHVDVIVHKGAGPFLSLVLPTVLSCLAKLIVALIIFKLVFQFDVPRLIWDALKVWIPVVGANARKIAMSRFSRSLAILYAAGVSMAESVDLASDVCGNLYIARSMKRAIPAIRSGTGLTEALGKTGAVSPIVLDMLIVGERTGSADTVLEKVADYMDDEVDASIHKISIALFVLMILIAAGIVGSIVVKFYSGFFTNILETAGQ
ncbi:MAG: type II secretion system F family protein [Armatimonadetes bacterium]|jgi:type IV pilus assembly protein PilC|nr:type II secretion system F family protein [Armatimonadota bacterium]